jgi:hypothetical protein
VLFNLLCFLFKTRKLFSLVMGFMFVLKTSRAISRTDIEFKTNISGISSDSITGVDTVYDAPVTLSPVKAPPLPVG